MITHEWIVITDNDVDGTEVTEHASYTDALDHAEIVYNGDNRGSVAVARIQCTKGVAFQALQFFDPSKE